MPTVVPRSNRIRDENFTGEHEIVIVLVVLAVIAVTLSLIFSLRKAREENLQAKERGAFVRILQGSDNEPSMAEMLAAPIPALRAMRA